MGHFGFEAICVVSFLDHDADECFAFVVVLLERSERWIFEL